MSFGNWIGVIGLAQGLGFGIFGTWHSYQRLPPPHTLDTEVSVAVALEGPDQYGFSYAGQVDVRLYNMYGQLVGPPQVDHKIGTGNSKYTIYYKHRKDRQGQQAVYGLFTGNDDAICIAWVGITRPDGTKYLASGDWAHDEMCGNAGWGISNLQLGISDKGEPYLPYCIWIDKNHDQPTASFQFEFPRVAPRADGGLPTLSDICDTPSFAVSTESDNNKVWVWADPFHKRSGGSTRYFPSNGHVGVADLDQVNTTRTTQEHRSAQQARQKKRRLQAVDDRLIITARPQHRASELCNSPNSRGPSVIAHHEGMFCDMTIKALYRLCSKGLRKDSKCFNETTHSIESADTAGKVITKRTTQLSFSKILDWTRDSDTALQ